MNQKIVFTHGLLIFIMLFLNIGGDNMERLEVLMLLLPLQDLMKKGMYEEAKSIVDKVVEEAKKES